MAAWILLPQIRIVIKGLTEMENDLALKKPFLNQTQ